MIKNIKFKVLYGGIQNEITIGEEKLKKWRNISEYIDTLMNLYHESDTIEININHLIDLYGLLIVFEFFDTEKIMNIESCIQKQKIFLCLSYFGIDSDILESVRKGYGLVWKLSDIDSDVKKQENELKEKINTFNSEIDKDILLNTITYNDKYNFFRKNLQIVSKLYGTLTFSQNIIPEFDIEFIKNKFEKMSNHLFDDIKECVVTGGMVSKLFTCTEYLSNINYDIFLITKDKNTALLVIKQIYERLNNIMKTYILKTKNTITFYNTKFEIQIVTKLYGSISEVFTDFDLDSCCVGYSNGNIYGFPRFIRSLAYSGNILDPERQSATYISRLKKYVKRGFTLYIPGLKRTDPYYNIDNYICKKLKEKIDCYNQSDYIDMIVYIKNRNYNEITETLEKYHKKGTFFDIFEIKDINHLMSSDYESIIKINWTDFIDNTCYQDFYKNMYFSKYIKN